MAVKQAPGFGQHEADMIGLAVRPQTKIRLEKNLLAASKVLNINRGYGPIRYCNQSTFIGADACGSQADVFDRARAVAEAAHVAHANYFIAEYGTSPEQIRNRLLRTETDGKTADAKSGQRRAHVESEVAEHGERARYKHCNLENSLT